MALGLGLGLGLTTRPKVTVEQSLVDKYDGGSSGYFTAESEFMVFSSGTDIQRWNPVFGSSAYQELTAANQGGLISNVAGTGLNGIAEGSSGNLFLESVATNITGRTSCFYALMVNLPASVTPQQVMFALNQDSSKRILMRTNEDAVWDDSEGGNLMTSLVQSVTWTAGWQIFILNNTTVDTTDVYHNALTKLKTFSMDDDVTTGGLSRQLLNQVTGFGQSGQGLFTRKYMELDSSTTEAELQALMISWASEVGLTLGA